MILVGIICIRKAEQEDCCNFKASIGYKLMLSLKNKSRCW